MKRCQFKRDRRPEPCIDTKYRLLYNTRCQMRNSSGQLNIYNVSEWWNGLTRTFEGRIRIGCGFKSRLRHHNSQLPKVLSRLRFKTFFVSYVPSQLILSSSYLLKYEGFRINCPHGSHYPVQMIAFMLQ